MRQRAPPAPIVSHFLLLGGDGPQNHSCTGVAFRVSNSGGHFYLPPDIRYDAILDHLTRFARNHNRLDANSKLVTAELETRLNSTETMRARVGHACDAPGLLAAAAAYCIALLVNDTKHGLEQFVAPENWTPMVFFFSQTKGNTLHGLMTHTGGYIKRMTRWKLSGHWLTSAV